MKHIDSIINRATTSLLTEQVNRDKYNPSSPTNPKYKDDVEQLYAQSKLGNVWPTDIPRKKYSPNIETLFTKIGAKPILNGFLTEPRDKLLAKNKGLASFEWFFAVMMYSFEPDHTLIADTDQLKGKQRVLYWRYSDLPVRITNRNDNDYKGKQIAYIAPHINFATPEQLTKVTKKFEQEQLIDVQLSKKGFGCFIVSIKEGGPAEFTIYISESGQPAILYATDAAAMKQKLKWKKSKEEMRAVMDILGFVPVIGDALDFVQALWYIYDFCGEDGEWSDLGYALLSLIAVLPVVGSFISASYKIGKAAFKTTKIIRKQRKQIAAASRLTSADDIVKLFEKTVCDPTFTKKEIEVVRKGLQLTIGGFLKYAKRARTFMKGNPEKLRRFDVALEEINQVYGRFSRSLNKVSEGMDAGIDLATGALKPSILQRMTSLITKGAVKKVEDLPIEELKIWEKGLNWAIKYLNPVKWLKSTLDFSIPESTAKVVYENIEATFFKGLSSPEFLRVIFSASSPELRTTIQNIAQQHVARSAEWNRIIAWSQRSGAGFTDATYWSRVWNSIPPANRSSFTQALGTTLMSQKHPVWLELVADPLTQIKNYLPKSFNQFNLMLKGSLSNPARWIRLVIDLFHDAAHDATGIFDDDPQSLAYQTLKKKLGKQYSNSLTGQFIQKMVVDPGMGTLRGGANWLGLDKQFSNLSNQTTPFDVPGHERGKEWVDPATNIYNKNITPKKKAATTNKNAATTNKNAATPNNKAAVIDRTGKNISL